MKLFENSLLAAICFSVKDRLKGGRKITVLQPLSFSSKTLTFVTPQPTKYHLPHPAKPVHLQSSMGYNI